MEQQQLEYTFQHQLESEVHRASKLAWNQYKLAEAATKKKIMHAFREYHFLDLQDDNGDVVRYTSSNGPVCSAIGCSRTNHRATKSPGT